jgi:malonate-semialdehyde dehydrogenase (acetylating)/methylmalonate-semialdehyde dehydrogenase
MFMFLGHVPGTDLGPVISPQAKERILGLVQSGVDQGASLLLDGRKITVPGYEKGNFVGPTILADVKVYNCYIISIFNISYYRRKKKKKYNIFLNIKF